MSEQNDIPDVFHDVAEGVNKELTRRKNEAAEAEASEAYQNTLDEFREVARFSKDFLSILIQEGIPVSLAQGMVRDHADNFSAEHLRQCFRRAR